MNTLSTRRGVLHHHMDMAKRVPLLAHAGITQEESLTIAALLELVQPVISIVPSSAL